MLMPSKNFMKLLQMNYLQTFMESTYSKAKICPYSSQGEGCEATWELEPDLVEVMSSSHNYDELEYVWEQWRQVSGNTYREQYLEFIKLKQEAARSLGFDNVQDQWLEKYESDDFPGLIQQVWTERFIVDEKERSLEMFYKHLHAYVRNKLIDVYNPQGAAIEEDGLIPANILGNMWSQVKKCFACKVEFI